jgi:hypothetical protein
MVNFNNITKSGIAYTLRLVHPDHKKYALKDSISVLTYFLDENRKMFVDSNNMNGYIIPLRQISNDSGKVIFQSRYLSGDTLAGKIIYFIRKPEQIYETDVYRLVPIPYTSERTKQIFKIL